MTRVVVGLVCNSQKEVLIALRGKHQHQGGLWEFPGGKLEPGEIETDALARELKEELGILVTDSQFYLTTKFDYGDKFVELMVYKVRAFSGEPVGNEGQELRWIYINDLARQNFPAANEPIILALQQSEN
jgi:8-oxo-dGTP diphosphatase